jgi:hypothetical protein
VWLIDRVNSLEDTRNDAAHAPLFNTERSIYGLAEGSEKISPASWLFNPRALKLSQRENLLREFRYCRDAAIILSDYARAIDRALINPKSPWPKKPALPNRPPKK